jgi:hypothetical protein
MPPRPQRDPNLAGSPLFLRRKASAAMPSTCSSTSNAPCAEPTGVDIPARTLRADFSNRARIGTAAQTLFRKPVVRHLSENPVVTPLRNCA